MTSETNYTGFQSTQDFFQNPPPHPSGPEVSQNLVIGNRWKRDLKHVRVSRGIGSSLNTANNVGGALNLSSS